MKKRTPWNKGLSTPISVRKKISIAHIGLHHSDKTIEKMSKAHSGHLPTRKGPHSIDTKKRISNSLIGIKRSEITRNKISEAKKGSLNPMFGKKLSVNHRYKISVSLSGEKAPNWKGGLTKINSIIRGSLKYRLWREAVFKRDGYMCVIGGKEHGSILHADHIKSFSKNIKLRFDVNNGRTLCVACHKKTETYLNRKK